MSSIHTQVPDSKVENITSALQAAIDRCHPEAPESIGLEHYSSQNFIGLFIEDSHAEFMRKVTQEFAAEAQQKTGKENIVNKFLLLYNVNVRQ